MWLLLWGVPLAGCDSACRNSCEHLQQDCGVETPGVSLDDCVVHCEDFVAHYDGRWQEDAANAAVACVEDAACADLQAGNACRHPAISVW
jgi:hypothetical protein